MNGKLIKLSRAAAPFLIAGLCAAAAVAQTAGAPQGSANEALRRERIERRMGRRGIEGRRGVERAARMERSGVSI